MGSLTNMFKPALLLSLLLAAAAKPGRGPAPRREANPLPASSRLFSRVFSGGPGLSRKAAQPAKERQEDYPWYGSYTYDDNFYYNYNGDLPYCYAHFSWDPIVRIVLRIRIPFHVFLATADYVDSVFFQE